MDIFEFALSREKKSEAYYRELAGKCPDAGLRNILARLAAAEVRHAEVVERMREDADVEWQEDTFLSDVRDSFADVRDRGVEFDFNVDQVDLYRKAQGFEQESMELYRKGAREAESPNAKAVLQRLAAQEKMHYQILETIVEVVGRPLPGNWLENAEWYHLEEY